MSPQTASLDDLLARAETHLQEGDHRRAINLYRRAQRLAPFRQDIRQLIAEAIDQHMVTVVDGGEFAEGDFEETRRARPRRERHRAGGMPFLVAIALMGFAFVLALALFIFFQRIAQQASEIEDLAPAMEVTEEDAGEFVADIAAIPPGDSPDALIAEAQALLQQGQHDDAMALLEEARAQGGEDSVIRPLLAEVHLQRGRDFWNQQRFNRARQDTERATELDPTNAEAFYSLGWSHFSIGRSERNARNEEAALEHFQAAREAFEQSVGLDPAMAKSHWGLSQVHWQLDNREGAFEEARETIRLEPGSTQADRARSMLQSHNMPLPEI